MPAKRISLVLDCDGVLTDIWKPSENRLRQYSDMDLAAFIDAGTSIEQLRAFARGFSFSRDTIDFEFTNLTHAQKFLVCSSWNERVFQNPDYLCDYTGTTSQDWTNFELGSSVDTYTDWQTIARWLDSLTEFCDITIHTHIDKRYAPARQEWFEHNILAQIQDKSKIKLTLDTGTIKQQLQGDIVVEDRLYNLLNAQADCKILRGQFHNKQTAYNLEIWQQFMKSPIRYHQIKPICVASFSEMVTEINRYIDRRCQE